MPHMMQRLALAGAMLGIAAVLALDPLSDRLFAFHMTQHLLLIVIAAPLLVLSGAAVRVRPVAGWCLFVCTFLFWHWPLVFRWAASHPPTGLLELGTVLFTAWLFWSVALGESVLSHGARALYVMTCAIVTDLPGVVMLFSPRAICTMPGENAAAFGLTPLQDQQLAGLLMWVPANLAFFGIATFLFALWMREPRPVPHRLVTS